MDLLLAIILGIIQGVTEWFPISSTGHLVMVEHLGGEEPPIFFDLMLHLGSLVVVLILFKKEVKELLNALFVLLRALPKKDRLKHEIENNQNARLVLYLILGSIPIYMSGLIVHLFFRGAYKNLLLVGCGLILTSILLIFTRGRDGHKKANSLGNKNVLLVGIAQAFAIVPGISRSGSTISAGLLQDFDKEFAYRFSFLLFIPAIIGAAVVESIQVMGNGYETSLILPTLVGTAAAMVTGYFTIKALHTIIRKRKLYLFWPYCLVLGVVVIVYYFFW